jgi:hypothetical protein
MTKRKPDRVYWVGTIENMNADVQDEEKIYLILAFNEAHAKRKAIKHFNPDETKIEDMEAWDVSDDKFPEEQEGWVTVDEADAKDKAQ